MTFEPIYRISDVLLANIKRVAEIVTELNARRFSGVVLVELERRARELSAYSSTSIEGNPLPLTDVKRLLKTRPASIRDSEREVLNYNTALTDLDGRIKKERSSFDFQLILEIQKTVTDELIARHRSGRLRHEPVFVNDPRTRRSVYLPPDHSDVPVLMQSLLEYVDRSENIIDALIVAGIFHKQFVIIHPFIDGNGRTARLATKALLAKMGVDTFNLFSFENYYNRNVSKYFQEVGEFGNYYDIREIIDFTPWLEYFTAGIIDELLRVSKDLDREAKAPVERLEEYHQKILTHVSRYGSIADRDYAKLTDRARPTRHLDFRKLIELGKIEKVGQGRATYYQLRG
jgi:Fic family protein